MAWVKLLLLSFLLVIVEFDNIPAHILIPYILTCPLPSKDLVKTPPIAVSVVANTTTRASNILQLTGSQPSLSPQKSAESMKADERELLIGVCMPALYYYNIDFSIRLLEWVELLKKIGVTKFYAYRSSIHKNLDKVLRYYEEKGDMKIIDFNYPPPIMDYPVFKRLWTKVERLKMFAMENIYHTDCVLRYKDEVDYIAHYDPDEVPILLKHKTLQDLVRFTRLRHGNDTLSSIQLKWHSFFNDLVPEENPLNISKAFHILRHTQYTSRLVNQYYDNQKSLYNTKGVLGVGSHTPFLYVTGSKIRNVIVPTEVAYLAHYRAEDCGQKCPPQTLINEFGALKYAKEIVAAVGTIAEALDLESNIRNP